MKNDWDMSTVERSLKFTALEKQEKQQQTNEAAKRMAARRATAFRFLGGVQAARQRHEMAAASMKEEKENDY